jgi:FkbM family methyltransferase
MSYEDPLLMPEHVKGRLRQLGFQPRTVLDIGAYEGYWSKDIKRIFPSCQPFMIEGDKDKDELLSKCGFPYEIALLSESKKDVTFYKSHCKYTTGNSIYPENSNYFRDPKYFHTEKVTTTTLQDVVERNGITDIDLIKLDVQGSEKDIMLGGLDVVRGSKAIFIEMPVVEYNVGSPNFVEMVNFLDQLGFRFADIVDLRYDNCTTQTLTQFDAIFLRK